MFVSNLETIGSRVKWDFQDRTQNDTMTSFPRNKRSFPKNDITQNQDRRDRIETSFLKNDISKHRDRTEKAKRHFLHEFVSKGLVE